MPQKKHKPGEIVAQLRQVDVLLSQGRPVAEAVRSIGVTQFTYYRWRKGFGVLKSDQVRDARFTWTSAYRTFPQSLIVTALSKAPFKPKGNRAAQTIEPPGAGYPPFSSTGRRRCCRHDRLRIPLR